MPGGEFIDYYELMQISPNAELETVQRVYRMLAARYHPDNPQTGDVEKFITLKEAFKILTDPVTRQQYDAIYASRHAEPLPIFEMKEFAAGIEGETNRRMGILCLLYRTRRANPESPGMSILQLESIMSFPREHLMFTIWYLKDKQYVRQDDRSDFLITAEGVDYVEANLPANRILHRLLEAAGRSMSRSDIESAEFASPET